MTFHLELEKRAMGAKWSSLRNTSSPATRRPRRTRHRRPGHGSTPSRPFSPAGPVTFECDKCRSGRAARPVGKIRRNTKSSRMNSAPGGTERPWDKSSAARCGVSSAPRLSPSKTTCQRPERLAIRKVPAQVREFRPIDSKSIVGALAVSSVGASPAHQPRSTGLAKSRRHLWQADLPSRASERILAPWTDANAHLCFNEPSYRVPRRRRSGGSAGP